MVLKTQLKMVCLRVKYWASQLATLLDWCLDMVTESYLTPLMANYLVIYLELQMQSQLEFVKELSWVIQMANLMVILNKFLLVHCLVAYLDHMMVLH